MNDLTEMDQLVHAFDTTVDLAGLARPVAFLDVDFRVSNSSVHLLIVRSVQGHLKAEDVGVIDKSVEFRTGSSEKPLVIYRKNDPARVGIRIWLEAAPGMRFERCRRLSLTETDLR